MTLASLISSFISSKLNRLCITLIRIWNFRTLGSSDGLVWCKMDAKCGHSCIFIRLIYVLAQNQFLATSSFREKTLGKTLWSETCWHKDCNLALWKIIDWSTFHKNLFCFKYPIVVNLTEAGITMYQWSSLWLILKFFF